MNKEEKEEAKRQKLLKKLEREEKAKAKKAETQKRKLEQEAKRALKPGECLKHLTLAIDPRLVSETHGRKIISVLSEKDQKYEIQPMPHPSIITFWREVCKVVDRGDSQFELDKNDVPQDEVLLIFTAEEFVLYIQNKPGQESLKSFLQGMKRKLEDRNITLIVQGMKFLQKRQKGRKETTFSRIDLEETLLDIQITMDCNVVFTESDGETGQMVFHYLKAVAETPFKRDKFQNTVMDIHIDSSSTVRMDKDGTGVTQAWRNIIQIFKNVSADQANAIMAEYPTPRSLMEAYQTCTEKEGKKLLENINVRRGYGVLESNRRIGPELSKKIYTLFTSSDPEVILK